MLQLRLCVRAAQLRSSRLCLELTERAISISHHPVRNQRLARAPAQAAMTAKPPPPVYASWTPAQLIERISSLESQLQAQKRDEPNRTYASLPPPPIISSSAHSAAAAAQPADPSTKPRKPPKRASRPFDPSRYTTRLVALKFAYLGGAYNGFEHHGGREQTPLPTIEEELWKALVKCRLIFPLEATNPAKAEKAAEGKDEGCQEEEEVGAGRGDETSVEPSEGVHKRPGWPRRYRPFVPVNWEGCEYTKCGRTDRGVSAFGQVIGIRVRSNRPLPRGQSTDIGDGDGVESDAGAANPEARVKEQAKEELTPFDPVQDELPYLQILNRALPPDIRMLAWCPDPPPGFSARFNCAERRYRYFFTQPSFPPTHTDLRGRAVRDPAAPRGWSGDGWLDVEAMTEAAEYMVGLHDFRNFCKVDPSKQITNFMRRIRYAAVEQVSPLEVPRFLRQSNMLPAAKSGGSDTPPQVYAFVIHGSAFLWHQVRHLVAVLFMVGQGLEKPSVVKELLDVKKNPTKPKYEMASDTPLVLWDCVFPASGSDRIEEGMNWVYAGDTVDVKVHDMAKWGIGGLMENLWGLWRKRKMDELLAGSLLDLVAAQSTAADEKAKDHGRIIRSARLNCGEDLPRLVGNYVPIVKKPRRETVETINARYAKKKGLSQDILPKNVDADE